MKRKHKKRIRKPTIPKVGMTIIAYKEKEEIKQKLRMIAAKQGHGSMGRVVRQAVREYLSFQDGNGDVAA